MADKKVSELDPITGADTAADDLFLIVDASGSVTKKITRAELNNAIEQDVLSTVDINGGTIDSTVIGGTTPAAGDFTTLTANGLTVDGDASLDGTAVNFIFNETDTTNLNTRLRLSGALFSVATVNDSGGSPKAHIVVNNSSGDISFYDSTGVTQGFFWDASTQRLGVGTTTPARPLHLQSSSGGGMFSVEKTSATTSAFVVAADSGAVNLFARDTNSGSGNVDFGFNIGSTRAMTIDSSRNVGIGTASPTKKVSASIGLNDTDGLALEYLGDNKGGILLNPIGGEVRMGAFNTSGTYFTTLYSNNSEAIRIQSDGSVQFKPDGVTADMTLDASGNLMVGKTSGSFTDAGVRLLSNGQIEATVNGNDIVNINRLSSDGSLVRFFQNTVLEGNISVSGSAVSYNGGHLARWSRLADDSKDMSIVKGTVMTNLDAMVEWGDEDNEQLNKMTVSSIEGDANVAGVFVNWDDSDDWNDMNVAMTGDMVIRIAQGTTVARGDLLMSAGDGTAKPQGEDIVRSKTIAKVTSTHISHTYDDGSYLVPCVLMAC